MTLTFVLRNLHNEPVFLLGFEIFWKDEYGWIKGEEWKCSWRKNILFWTRCRFTSVWSLVSTVGTFYRKWTLISEVRAGWDFLQKRSSRLSEACSLQNLRTDTKQGIRNEQNYTSTFLIAKSFAIYLSWFFFPDSFILLIIENKWTWIVILLYPSCTESTSKTCYGWKW